VVLAGGVLVPAVNRTLQQCARSLAGLSQTLSSSVGGALAALAQISETRSVVLRAFALSVVNQGLPVLAIVALAVPLDALVPLYWFAVIVPFVTLVSLLPVSIGGAGVRELLYVALFGAVGMQPEAALALSLSVFAASIVWGLNGLAVFALDPGRTAAAPAASPAIAEEA
jgi:hypothetical protein